MKSQARAVDPARLFRALGLTVTPESPWTYRVTGGEASHQVQVVQGGWACDCPDAIYRRGLVCKHRLAVYLARQLAPPVRMVLASIVEEE